MLDLWFGLDASGFDNSGVLGPSFLKPAIHTVGSKISSYLWSYLNGYICLSEQHPSLDWYLFLPRITVKSLTIVLSSGICTILSVAYFDFGI